MITQELLKKQFSYDNGKLLRNFSSGGQKVGSFAGWINTVTRGKRYIRLNVCGEQIYLHQAIFLMHHGYLPKCIDHINGNSFDNRIENLREANQSLNTANSVISKANTSGYKGVVWRKDTNKWMAQISKNKKHYNLGSFEKIEDAAKAYKIAAEKFFGEFARPEASNRNIDRSTQ
jgi:hypothetical protein